MLRNLASDGFLFVDPTQAVPLDQFSTNFFSQIGVTPVTPVADVVSKLQDAGDAMLAAVIYHSDHLELSKVKGDRSIVVLLDTDNLETANSYLSPFGTFRERKNLAESVGEDSRSSEDPASTRKKSALTEPMRPAGRAESEECTGLLGLGRLRISRAH
jgi:hypothetical protein